MRFLASSVAEKGFSEYELALYGVTENGEPRKVVLKGARVFFEVFPPRGETSAGRIFTLLRGLNEEDDGELYKSLEEFRGRYWDSFPAEQEAVRVLCRSPFQMRKAVEALRVDAEAGRLRLAHETTTNYYRVVSRDYSLPLMGWIEFSKHSTKAGSKGAVPELGVSIDDVSPCTVTGLRDLTRVLYWDLEAWCGKDGNPTVLATRTNTKINYDIQIISVGAVYAHIGSPVPLARYCYTDHPVDPVANQTNVPCVDEREMLCAFLDQVRLMRPSIVCGFNDASFDWPLLIRRCNFHNINERLYSAFCWDQQPFKLKDYLYMLHVPGKDIFHGKEAVTARPIGFKIDNSISVDLNIPTFPGTTAYDLMPPLRKAHPKDKYSLESFLRMDKHEAKLPIEFTQVWHAYETRDSPDPETRAAARALLTYNTEYNVYDAYACMLLQNGRSMIGTRREFANYSYVALADAMYRADAMKVENLVFHMAEEHGYHPSTETRGSPKEKEDDKNLGAHCACYQPGRDRPLTIDYTATEAGKTVRKSTTVRAQRPVTELDFSSLYPSIAMNHNLSHETITHDPAHVRGELHYEFEFETKQGRKVHAYALDDGMDVAKKGVLPLTFIFLYGERTRVRQQIPEYAEVVERFEAEYRAAHPLPAAKAEHVAHARRMRVELSEHDEYNVACRAVETLDAKQLAIKILLNTIYGATGAPTSTIYNPVITGAITHYGRKNIQDTAAFGESLGYVTAYIDTDSNYVICPEALFHDMDIRFARGELTRREWEREMVMASYANVRDVYHPLLSAHIRDENRGKPYLKMELGKVMGPRIFTKPKMYHGVHHNPNNKGELVFSENYQDPANQTIKGMGMKRQDTTPFVKKVGQELLNELYENWEQSVEDIVLAKLREVYTAAESCYDHSLFSKTLQWRPHKNNVTVQRFVKRMSERCEADPAEWEFSRPPDPNTKFTVVLTQQQHMRSLRGSKLDLSVGDRYEYVGNVARLNLQIDRRYYFERFHAMCAQQLTYMFPDSETAALAHVTHFVDSLQCVDDGKLHKQQFAAAKKAIIQRFNGDLRRYRTILAVVLRNDDQTWAREALTGLYVRWNFGFRAHGRWGSEPMFRGIEPWLRGQRAKIDRGLAALIATLRAGLTRADPLAGGYVELAELHYELLKLGYVCSQRVAL